MSQTKARVLVVDDEAPLMEAICASLESKGYTTMGFTVATEALETLRQQPFDVILSDLMMPVMDGVSVVKAALEIDPNLASIIMTGHASVDTAVSALKTGAMDYVQKPFKLSAIVPILDRALETRRLRMENVRLQEMVDLHELSVNIALAQDQPLLLKRVADAAMTQTRADGVCVLLAEDQGQGAVLRAAAVRGTDDFRGRQLEVSSQLREWAAHAGTDFETAAPLGGFLPEGFTVPMMAGGQLAGLIHCRPAGAAVLTPGQKRGMSILAGTAGSAFAALAAVKQLRTAEARYRLLAEEAPDVVCHFELQPRRAMTYVNPAVFAVTGYKPEEYYADPDLILRIVHPEDRGAAETVWRGEAPASDLLTVRWITKSGSEVWVEQRSRLLRDAAGNVIAVEAVSRDVTERKALEEKLRHSQRLEAIGTLTSGIAHDFNNLLTVINGFSALAAQDQPPGSLAGSRIHEIQEAGKQAAAITSQLLAFGRKQTLRPRTVNLADVIAGCGTMIRSSAGSGVDVKLPDGPSEAYVKVDPVQIQQAVLNLTVNARDAMDGKGRLKFELCDLTIDGASAASLRMPAGDYVRLTVADTGCGMVPEICERIFEPFFTTKEVGRGTGLGLSMVHGIMEQSGGSIRVESERGVGTRFLLWFPKCEAVKEIPAAEPIQVPRGHETILLVEDMERVRRFNQEVLLNAGYRLYTAADAEEAWNLARSHAEEIDLVVSDVRLPGSDGFELAERIRSIHPRAKFLFISGFTEEVPESRTSTLLAWDFLAKPYAPTDLCERIHKLLGANLPATANPPKRVLVVDDERPIRRFFQEVLENAGYAVVTAENGKEATRCLHEDENIDVVLTDLVMPEMEGIEFISAVRKSRPDLKIVATTGGQHKVYLQGAAMLGATATLSKPVAPEALLSCLQNL